jgi:hypothetical protein
VRTTARKAYDTTRTSKRWPALLVTASLAATAAAAPGSASGDTTQLVQGRVTAQFAAGVGADGTISTAPTTIPASVTRERVGDVEVVTIAPRE